MTKTKKYVLCIAGSRDIYDYSLVEKSLSFAQINLNDVKELIYGDGKGINANIKDYCERTKIKSKQYKADWKNIKVKGAIIADGPYGKYNKRAAADRDNLLLEKADSLIFIYQRDSKELENLVKKAIELNKTFCVYELDSDFTKDPDSVIMKGKSKENKGVEGVDYFVF